MFGNAACAPVTDGSNYANRRWDVGDGNASALFGTCDSQCPTPVETGSITVCLDPSSQSLPNGTYTNLVANGNFANWNGWGITLTDPDGDGIYCGTKQVWKAPAL